MSARDPLEDAYFEYREHMQARPGAPPPPDKPASPAGAFRLIGKATPRIDGAKIVTGKARYTHDLYFADMLHGKGLRSPHAAAEIVSIDLGPALALPEVKAVL